MDRQLESEQAIAREIIDDCARYQSSGGEVELRAIADLESYLPF